MYPLPQAHSSKILTCTAPDLLFPRNHYKSLPFYIQKFCFKAVEEEKCHSYRTAQDEETYVVFFQLLI